MSEFDPLSAELQDFESSLARLTPAASRIDRDRLMFRLGQESSRHAQRPWRVLWPASSAALLLVSGLLGWQLANVERPQVLYVDRPSAEKSVETSIASTQRNSDQNPPASSSAIRVENPALAMNDAWLDAPGVLGVRSLHHRTVEALPTPAPQASSDLRSTDDRPALRFGDREGWQKWLEGPASKDSIRTSIQKDSA